MRPYKLPALSGVLLALVFFPFYIWPLAFVALAPLWYWAAQRPDAEVWRGGFVAGAIVGIPVFYFTLWQLTLQPDGPLLTQVVRASALFFIPAMGAVMGGMLCALAWLRTRFQLLNIALAASLYGLYESFWYAVFGGYNYVSLSHAVVPFPPALWFAGAGGALLVTWLVAAANGALAEGWRAFTQNGPRSIWPSAGFLLAVCIGAGAAYYVRPIPTGETLNVSIAQPGVADVASLPYGGTEHGAFSDPSLEALLHAAVQQGGIVIYPFSPVRGIIAKKSAPVVSGVMSIPYELIASWARQVAASSTLITWDTVGENGQLYDQYDAWSGGETAAVYTKRALYSLSDYTPPWAQALGLRRLPYTIAPGIQPGQFTVAGAIAGGLICSELHNTGLARSTAHGVPFIIAIGSDAMFPGDLAGDWSIAAARLRAAENDTAIVRGNALGPSAIVNADGSIESELPFGTPGVVWGAVSRKKGAPTLYARWGDTPIYVLEIVVLALAFAASRSRSLYRRG